MPSEHREIQYTLLTLDTADLVEFVIIHYFFLFFPQHAATHNMLIFSSNCSLRYRVTQYRAVEYCLLSLFSIRRDL